MNNILCKMTDEDAIRLTDTIVEVEMCKGLYDEAAKGTDFNPMALKTVFDYYIHSVKIHKALWRELLIKYVGEDKASELFMILRFDTIKKVIFTLDIEGCALCQK
jgi:hypothetical protein